MKGIIFVVLLIVSLIIGILVIQDLQTEDQTGTKNIERVDRAKDTAKNAQKTIDRIRQSAKDAGQSQPRPIE